MYSKSLSIRHHVRSYGILTNILLVLNLDNQIRFNVIRCGIKDGSVCHLVSNKVERKLWIFIVNNGITIADHTDHNAENARHVSRNKLQM